VTTSLDGSDDSLIPSHVLVCALAGLVLAGIIRVAAMPTTGDVAWHLYLAERVLDGARPYIDLVETNPPLIIAINMAIVGLARGIGLSPLLALPVVVFGLSGLSLGLSWRLGRGLPLALRQVSLLAWAYLLFVQIGMSFGQREHLKMILILPYAFGAVAEARGDRPSRAIAICSGLLAGVGFGLKPFFVPAVLAVEFFLAARKGPRVWLRPQALAMTAVFVAYAVLIVAWTPQYFDVARRFAPLYPHHQPFGLLLWASSWRLGVVVSAMILSWRVMKGWAEGWASIFGLLAAWLTVAVYLNGKGWIYHWFPPMALALAMLVGVVARIMSRWPRGSRRGWSTAMLAILVPGLSILSISESLSFRVRDEKAGRLVCEQAQRGETVLVLSCLIHRSFPMINEAGATWGMRHPMLWQIAAFYPDGTWKPGAYHSIGAMSAAERRFVGEVASDFSAKRPAILLVDDEPPLPSMVGFDYLAYLQADPTFADLLDEYTPIGRSRFFRIYRRRDSGPVSRHVSAH
jgi:hypothetical protein